MSRRSDFMTAGAILLAVVCGCGPDKGAPKVDPKAAPAADAKAGTAGDSKAAPATPPKRQGDDKEMLQGAWKAVARESDGKAEPEDNYSGNTITFDGDKFILRERGQPPSVMTFKLDPSKSPKTVDLVIADGPNKDHTLPGIYQLDGDDLKINMCVGKERPKEFKTKAGDDSELYTLKRLPVEQPWKRFTADGFSVEMPGEPEARKGRDDSAGVSVEATTYVVRSDREGLSFLAMGYASPTPIASDADRAKAIDAVCANLTKTYGGEPAADRKLDIKQGAGRELVLRPKGAFARVQVIIVKSKMFVLQVVGTEDPTKAASAERFFKSFQTVD